MNFIKQSLRSNDIDFSDIEELGLIFEKLGNQQEAIKVYSVVDKYLSDLPVGYSIWKFEDRNELENVWMTEKDGDKRRVNFTLTQIKEVKDSKRLVTIKKGEHIYKLVPIVSREKVVGIFCIHDDLEISENWKKIYVVVALLSFVLKYYEMIAMVNNLSTVDPVTGLYNSRHFNMQVGLEIDKAKRFNKPLTLAVVRIKDFGVINNKLGFAGGEATLREFGKIFKRLTRKTDMPSKLEGENFAVLMYETNEEGANFFIKRLKEYLSVFQINVDSYKFNIEIDHNIVQYKREYSPEEFLEKANEL